MKLVSLVTRTPLKDFIFQRFLSSDKLRELDKLDEQDLLMSKNLHQSHKLHMRVLQNLHYQSKIRFDLAPKIRDIMKYIRGSYRETLESHLQKIGVHIGLCPGVLQYVSSYHRLVTYLLR